MNNLADRLFELFRAPIFLSMSGQSEEVPLFIQTYDPSHEDGIRRMVQNLAARLRGVGVTVQIADLFDLVLQELEANGILADLVRDEPVFEKSEVLETLRNYSDPKVHLIPRLTY